MIDLNRTIKLVTGALFERDATWQSYLSEADDWKKTALLLTGPLIVVSAVVAYVLSLIFGGSSLLGGFRPTLLSTVVGIITSGIAIGVVSFIFSALAGVFGGKNNFPLGLAAVTLAFVPGFAGQALTWLPWIGSLLALGLSIFSLVLLWKIIPLYLAVPEEKRTGHFIVSLVGTIVVMLIIGTVINPVLYGPDAGSPMTSVSNPDRLGQSSDGFLANAVRRGALMEEAMKDTYTPPADGRLTQEQMRSYVAVVQRVSELQAGTAARMQELAEKVDKDGATSIGDIGAVFKAANEVGNLVTSEMEIVKDNGGNWAEHQWVAQSVLTASTQKDTNETVAHNYALYQQFENQITALQQ